MSFFEIIFAHFLFDKDYVNIAALPVENHLLKRKNIGNITGDEIYSLVKLPLTTYIEILLMLGKRVPI